MNIEFLESFQVQAVEIKPGGVPVQCIDITFCTWTDANFQTKRTWPRVRLPQTIAQDLVTALTLALAHSRGAAGPTTPGPTH